jgi:hypothetical protein
LTETIHVPPDLSDHCIVFGALSLNASTIKSNVLVTRCLNAKRLESCISEIQNIPFDTIWAFDNIDDIWLTFKELLLKLLDDLAPLKKVRVPFKRIPWCDAEVRLRIKERDALHGVFVKNGSNKGSSFWSDFVIARNKCKSLIRQKMKAYFAGRDMKSIKSTKKFWSIYKSVVKTKDSATNSIFAINNSKGITVNDPHDVGSVFSSHFGSLHHLRNANVSDAECVDFIDNFFNNIKKDGKLVIKENFEFHEVSSEMVKKSLSALDPCSSPGVTIIPPVILKSCAEELCVPLAKIFNFCIVSGRIPSDWKHAIVTPLFKKGDILSCDNYRGISVISPIGKIFERILSIQIVDHFRENNLFSKYQHGFRRDFSCETALHLVLDKWRGDIDGDKVIFNLFIDFKA